MLSYGTSEKRPPLLARTVTVAYSPGNAEGEEGCTRAHDEEAPCERCHMVDIAARTRLY